MQFAAASGLSRAERGVVRAVHLGFPANASTWSASHFFWLWQFHFWPAFLLRVSIGPGTCGLTRTVTYMLFCFIFLHLHHGAWTFSPSRFSLLLGASTILIEKLMVNAWIFGQTNS